MPQVSAYCATKVTVEGLVSLCSVRDFQNQSYLHISRLYQNRSKQSGYQPHELYANAFDVALAIIQAMRMPNNFHTVNFKIRPLQPKGPKA
jgi:NADP-dependent 3-hydroxy acid dehydrogenase YdfG